MLSAYLRDCRRFFSNKNKISKLESQVSWVLAQWLIYFALPTLRWCRPLCTTLRYAPHDDSGARARASVCVSKHTLIVIIDNHHHHHWTIIKTKPMKTSMPRQSHSQSRSKWSEYWVNERRKGKKDEKKEETKQHFSNEKQHIFSVFVVHLFGEWLWDGSRGCLSHLFKRHLHNFGNSHNNNKQWQQSIKETSNSAVWRSTSSENRVGKPKRNPESKWLECLAE